MKFWKPSFIKRSIGYVYGTFYCCIGFLISYSETSIIHKECLSFLTTSKLKVQVCHCWNIQRGSLWLPENSHIKKLDRGWLWEVNENIVVILALLKITPIIDWRGIKYNLTLVAVFLKKISDSTEFCKNKKQF